MRGEKEEVIILIMEVMNKLIFGIMHVQGRIDRLQKKNLKINLNRVYSFICP